MTRRLVGSALLVGTYVPLHRLLDPTRAGPAGEATRATADAAWGVGAYGTLLVLGVAVALTLLIPSPPLTRGLAAIASALERPGTRAYAAAVGLLAGLLSLAITTMLYGGLPTSVDEMAQLLHARALTEGRLALPMPGAEAAWTIQNGVVTPEGWASIYPPFHTLLLAIGLALGGAHLVGPVAVGIATGVGTLAFEELLGRLRGRIAGLLLSVSPFWLLLGGTYLSHTTAAACVVVVLWTTLRGRSGGIGWAVATGLAMGAAVTARPWIGLVTSLTVVAVLWGGERTGRLTRLGALVAGGLPFAVLLLWWNARLFGSPWRLGYSAAYGAPHALGLHVDPWGNVYGAREALGYTGADLVQLGAHLFETPLPAIALTGAALLAGMRSPGTRVFLAWVVTAVAANALYWHHGIHMGPRMLYESAPAWVALFVVSAAYLTSGAVPHAGLRRFAGWTIAAAGVGAVGLVPSLLSSAARSSETLSYALPPAPPVEGPALVFVHGSWASRVVARLSATGMRRDSIETALRRNDICDVDRYARWRESGAAGTDTPPPTLDLEALPGTPTHLRRARLSPGNEVWTAPDAIRDEPCARNARADQSGVVDIEPLLWQAPPLADRDLVLARDMGPDINQRVIEALGLPTLFLYAPVGGATTPTLLDYEDGMRRLWLAPLGVEPLETR